MTATEFQALCGEHGIHMDIALECQAVRDALKTKDLVAIEAALRENF